MKLLTFQAERFAWTPFNQTLEYATEAEPGEERDCLVVFFHAEQADQEDERHKKVFKQTLKHIKWLSNKREWKNVVLHSFTHLGGETADAQYGQTFMRDLVDRLQQNGYRVNCTPFGWFCSWEICVYGDSLAKVWKEI